MPFDTGTYGYGATVNAGAPFTPWLDQRRRATSLAGVYQHPSTDPQAGVAELELNFDYNANQLQWLLLAPGLINWVTAGHPPRPRPQLLRRGHRRQLHRRQRVELAVPVHPGGHEPARLHLPGGGPGVAPGSAPGVPADVQMTAADVANVVGLGAADRHHLEHGLQRRRGLHLPTRRTRRKPTAPAPTPKPTADDLHRSRAGHQPELPKRRRTDERPVGRQGRLQLDHPYLVAPLLGCTVWQPRCSPR